MGGGLSWSPVDRLSLSANYSDASKAPTIQQLNDPTVSTPNTPVFDFATGQTVEITQVTGGDPNLKAEDRHILKLGASWQPLARTDFRLEPGLHAHRDRQRDRQLPGHHAGPGGGPARTVHPRRRRQSAVHRLPSS